MTRRSQVSRSVQPVVSRRRFIAQSSAAGLALPLISRGLMAGSSNDKLRLGSVGVGGMGGADLGQLSAHPKVEVFALCDVDQNRLKEAASKHPNAKLFSDYREMLSQVGDQLDAVNVATPDHTHAPATMSAMNLGKHVYCQKPLTHDVFEARQLRLVAAEQGVVSQMGIQIHSNSEYRTAVKTIQSGAIGQVKEVFSWSNKTWGYDGPKPKPSAAPKFLDWDLWLGTAPERPFAQGHYHPGNWRKWLDFGCGTMGDMGIHILDPVFSALKIGTPTTAISSSPKPPEDSHGMKNRVTYTFPKTEFTTDDFKLTWSDGGLFPETDLGIKLPGQGSLFIGEKGQMLLPHIAQPTLFPREDFADFQMKTVPGENHYHLWVDACLGGKPTTAGFDYAGPLTEALLLGVVANRFPTQKLEWDTENVKITNFSDADAMIRRQYREGWEVENLS